VDSSTLIIRGQQNDDGESLFALWNSSAIIQNSFELPYITEEVFRERFGTPPANTHALIAEVILPSGRKRIIGIAWLQVLAGRMRHIGQLTCIIHPDYENGDAGSTLLEQVLDLADNWLGLRRIETIAYTCNAAAVALYQQHNFEMEATMRRYAFRNGEYADAYMMARLREKPE
jgi:putative acetyltransferase